MAEVALRWLRWHGGGRGGAEVAEVVEVGWRWRRGAEVALRWERSIRQWNRTTFLVEAAERAEGKAESASCSAARAHCCL